MNPPPPASTTPRRRNLGLPRAIVDRLVVAAVILGSFWAIWWSMNRLFALQTHSGTLNKQVARLTADIDLMRTRWTEARAQNISERHERIPATLFAGEAAVTEWIDTLQKDGIPLALETRIRIGELQASTNSAGQVNRVRITVDLQSTPDAPAARSLYHRVLEWSRKVALHSRRVDVIELSVTGGPGNGGSASATLELWSREPAVETPEPAQGQPASPTPTGDATVDSSAPPSEPAPANPPADPQTATPVPNSLLASGSTTGPATP